MHPFVTKALAIATLLSSFEIESVGTTDGREPREHLAFSMGPVGLRMRLKPGAPAAGAPANADGLPQTT